MPSSKDSFGLSGFEFLKIETYIPTFGKFCGPGWTAGTRENVSLKTLLETDPIQIQLPNGTIQISNLDYQCKFHDRDYFLAQGRPNKAELIAEADLKFINGVKENYESMTRSEKDYAILALTIFNAKYQIWDSFVKGIDSVREKIIESISEFNKKADLPGDVQYFDANDKQVFCKVNLDGSIMLGCSSEDRSEFLMFNKARQLVGVELNRYDENEGSKEQTTIGINGISKISEITHSIDGQTDVRAIMVGAPTQEKLDKFFELAGNSAAQNIGDRLFSSDNQTLAPVLSASAVLSSIDVPVNNYIADEIDQWFAQSEAICLQAKRWEMADERLRNIWLSENDTSLVTYDLQSVISTENMEWNESSHSSNYLDSHLMTDYSGSATQLSTDTLTSYQHSLSDIDLGSDNSYYKTTQYTRDNLELNIDSLGSGWSNSYIDPLVLKLGGGAVHTTNLQGSTVMFDMQANGNKVRTGWITPDHAFLVRDRNRNGVIDDSSEMFSERTSSKASTGFAALAQLDGNRDGWLDYHDKAYNELNLWTDINVDGLTQKGELHTLREFGINYLALAKPIAKNIYDNGNLILNVNRYWRSGRHGYSTGEIAEVLFNFGEFSSSTSVYMSDQAISVRTSDGRTIQLLSDKASQTINASMSGINLLIGGKGDVLNAGNSGQVLLIGNGETTMNGNAGKTRFVVNGAGNIVNTGTGDSFIEVNGDSNTINASRGDVSLEVEGNRNRITIGSDDYVALGGTGNILNAAASTKANEVVIRGQKAVVTLNNSSIALQEKASANVNGRNNDLTLQGNDNLSGNSTGGSMVVWGKDNIATVNHAFICLSDGAELQLSGKNDKILIANEGELLMKGSAAGSSVTVFGENNQVTMTGGALMMAEGAELDLAGRSNTVTMLGDGELHSRDRGQRVEVYGDDNRAWLNGSSVIEHGAGDIDLFGTANSLKNASSRPDQQLREELAYDHMRELVHTFWDDYYKQQDKVLSQDWRDLPQPASLSDAVMPVDTLWNSDGGLTQGLTRWMNPDSGSLLTSRPLINTINSAGSPTSVGASSLFN